jgi:hypothetical protein
MGMAKRSMPDPTDEELAAEERNAEAWQEWQWNYEESRSRFNPHADPKCPYCHGTGTVYDSVDYGSTTVQMPSTCDCVEDDEDGN